MAALPGPGTADPVDDTTWIAMSRARALESAPQWLDPESYPPDPEDPAAWSGDLDQAIARAQADGSAGGDWRAGLLAAGTGWAHCRGGPAVPGVAQGPGGGFGQGQPCDTAEPAPWLAALADQAAGPGRGYAGVGDDELMGLIGARSRLSARQSWELMMALAELIRRRPGPYCKPEGPAAMPRVWAEGTSAEVSVQLAITQRAATALLSLAWDLAVKLPRTAAALRAGVLDQDKAETIASWTAPLNQDQARAAEDLLFTGNPDIETMTWTMIRDRIARAVLTIDPDAARRRRRHGERDACIQTGPELSGNMRVSARELPPASALALDQKLTRRARELKRAGIPGTMARLRVLAYLERWGIADPFTETGGHDDGSPASTSQDPDRPSQDRDRPSQDSPGPGSPGPGSAGQGGQPAADWPEDWPRTDGRDREQHDSGSGNLDDHGEDGPGNEHPDGGNRPGGCGGGCACRGSPPATSGAGDNASAGWLHLTIPASTILRQSDRAGQLSKLGPVDADLARTLADTIARHEQSTICVTATGPDGRPVAHACTRPARGDPARRPPPRPPDIRLPAHQPATHQPASPALEPVRPPRPGQPAQEYGSWRLTLAGRDLDLDFEPLTGDCDHRHESPGHDPGMQLKHLTAVLNQDCTFRTCRTPGHQADYEHANPSDLGGRTCLCNGHPCCRRNHRNKQEPGWQVRGTGQPGFFTWTLPSGRSYNSKPTSYPT